MAANESASTILALVQLLLHFFTRQWFDLPSEEDLQNLKYPTDHGLLSVMYASPLKKLLHRCVGARISPPVEPYHLNNNTKLAKKNAFSPGGTS